MNQSQPAPKVGERIGRYELLQELGRGGFGVVYRARQQGLEADVALKLMLPSDAPQAKQLRLYERFEQEEATPSASETPEVSQPMALPVRRAPGTGLGSGK